MAKPSLVLIHGLAGSLDYFDPAARIANGDVRTLDLLGYGGLRDVSDDRLALQAQAEHVVSYLETDCRTPAWLLGHSMGGAVVMLVADQRPELARISHDGERSDGFRGALGVSVAGWWIVWLTWASRRPVLS